MTIQQQHSSICRIRARIPSVNYVASRGPDSITKNWKEWKYDVAQIMSVSQGNGRRTVQSRTSRIHLLVLRLWTSVVFRRKTQADTSIDGVGMYTYAGPARVHTLFSRSVLPARAFTGMCEVHPDADTQRRGI